MCTALVVVNISAPWKSVFGDVPVAQLVVSMSGVVQGGVVDVGGSNLASDEIFTASVAQLIHYISLYRVRNRLMY